MTTLQEALLTAALDASSHGLISGTTNWAAFVATSISTALAQQGEPEGWKPTGAAIAALKRFDETCSDGEGYDIPKDTMRNLQAIGLVYRTHGSVYCITDFGSHVLAAAPAPQESTQEKRPINCGTGHCSCIECLFDPAPQAQPVAAQDHCEQHLDMVAQPERELQEAFARGMACRPASAQPLRELSDEEIKAWWASENGLEDADMACLKDFTEVVRAVLKKARGE